MFLYWNSVVPDAGRQDGHVSGMHFSLQEQVPYILEHIFLSDNICVLGNHSCHINVVCTLIRAGHCINSSHHGAITRTWDMRKAAKYYRPLQEKFIHSIGMCRMRKFLAVLTDSSTPLCYIPFPSTFVHLCHQLVFHPPSLHLAIYFLVYLSALLLPNSYIILFFGNSIFFHSLYLPKPT